MLATFRRADMTLEPASARTNALVTRLARSAMFTNPAAQTATSRILNCSHVEAAYNQPCIGQRHRLVLYCCALAV